MGPVLRRPHPGDEQPQGHSRTPAPQRTADQHLPGGPGGPMTTVSLTDISSYPPGEPVPAAFFTEHPTAEDKLRDSPMFKVPPHRHHVGPGETNVDMIE